MDAVIRSGRSRAPGKEESSLGQNALQLAAHPAWRSTSPAPGVLPVIEALAELR